MSILDDLKNQPPPDPPSPASEPSAEVIETINQQTRALNALIEQVTELRKILSEQLDMPRSDNMQNVLNRLDEIEKSQSAIVNALDGKQLRESAHQISREAQRNHAGMVSGIESLTRQADENRKLFDHTMNAVARIEQRAASSIDQAAARAGEVIGDKITQNLTAVNERAEKITEFANRIDSRQAWSAAAAMFLFLLPVATVVAGFSIGVAGLVAAFHWAGGSLTTWGTVGRFIIAGGATLGTVVLLWKGVLWTARVVGVMRDKGMPEWPPWRR